MTDTPPEPDKSVLRDRRAARSREFDALVKATDQRREALMGVRIQRRAVDRETAQLATAVGAARQLGSSWAEIGLATGLTAEGARRRWGRA